MIILMNFLLFSFVSRMMVESTRLATLAHIYNSFDRAATPIHQSCPRQESQTARPQRPTSSRIRISITLVWSLLPRLACLSTTVSSVFHSMNIDEDGPGIGISAFLNVSRFNPLYSLSARLLLHAGATSPLCMRRL